MPFTFLRRSEVLLALALSVVTKPAPEPDTPPDITLQCGHSANISALAFSPDGRMLASASEDKTVRLWDAESAAQLHTLRGHGDVITAIGFSPDSSQIASASLDHSIRVWNAASGELERTFRGLIGSAFVLKFSPDSSLLITAETDVGGSTVRVWNIAAVKQVRILKRESAAISSLFFNANGSKVLIADESGEDEATGSLSTFDLKTGRLLETRAELLCGASENGKWIALDRSDEGARKAEIIDTFANKTVTRLDSQVSQVFFSPGGDWIAYGHASGDSAVVQRTRGGGARTIRSHSAEFGTIAISPDGHWIASAGPDYTVHIWDANSGQLAHALSGQYSPSVLAFSPDGQRLASSGGGPDSGNALQLWNLPEKSLLAGPRLRRAVQGLAFSHDGNYLAVSAPGLEVYDLRSNESIRKLACPADSVLSPVFSPNGKYLAANCRGVITIWLMRDGSEYVHFGEPDASNTSPLAFSPDSYTLAVGDQLGLVLYDIAAKRVAQAVKTAAPPSAVAFSSDGRELAVGATTSVFLWDRRTRRKLWEQSGWQWVSGLAFRVDGRSLYAVAGEDKQKPGSLATLDLGTGRQLKKIVTRISAGNSPKVSPDGQLFAVGAAGGIGLWRLP